MGDSIGFAAAMYFYTTRIRKYAFVAFDYTPVDFSKVKSVELTEKTLNSCANTNSTSETKEQKRRRSWYKFYREDFRAFEEEVGRILSVIDDPNPNEIPNQMADVLDIPNPHRCFFCDHRELVDGRPRCTGYQVSDNSGGTRHPQLATIKKPIPEWCERDTRNIIWPTSILDEIPERFVELLTQDYEEKKNDKIETYEERREECLKEGNTGSWYVTSDKDEWFPSEDRYAVQGLRSKLLCLFDPFVLEEDDNHERRGALWWAWHKHIPDEVNQDFQIQRAEAYLRTMDSEWRNDIKPGDGGNEFEEAVRRFVKNLGFPLGPRVFKITGNTQMKRKEMDINTAIAERGTIIEVYTKGAHSDKDAQVDDYSNLYEMVTGIRPYTLQLTDSRRSLQYITLDLLRQLLDHEPREADKIPGDYESMFSAEEETLRGKTVADLTQDKYSDIEIDYRPPQSARKVESQAAEIFRAHGFEPQQPVVNHNRRWTFLGPTVSIAGGKTRLNISLAGEARISRDEPPRTDEWFLNDPPWSRTPLGLHESGDVTTLVVTDDGQNRLTPRLFYRFLNHDT